MLSWSICSNFGAIYSLNMHRSLKSRKKHSKLLFGSQRLSMSVGYILKARQTQQVC